jgi:hypothetical protein
MKIYTRIFIGIAALVSMVACVNEPKVEFGLDTTDIQVGPEGGVRTIKVSSSENWVASTQQPWITISPANGRGTVECKVMIDSTLKFDEVREGKVYINGESDSQSFTVRQQGFQYQIIPSELEKNIADYAAFGSRSFEITVKANVDFKVKVPDNAANWLKPTKSALVLDRGSRPREVTVKFDWQVNSMPMERIAEVEFVPVETVQMGRNDGLKVVQKAALPIPVGTVEGDSLALLAVNRSLGVWTEFETSERIENWTGIEVWKTKDERNGRVKSAQFAAFTTKEGIPYEIQYLTAMEELFVFGNSNTFLIKELDCGPYVCMLPQLRKLTIGAYGLTRLHKDFTKLKNLEYLSLESNNFQTIPSELNEENFPKLTALILNANARYTVMDLSNDTRENIGGFVEEEGFPVRMLLWDNLDTLRLSVNYLQGELPSDEEMTQILSEKKGMVEYWRNSDLNIKDSIAVGNTFFEENDVPKVIPEMDFFAINLNRLYGELPNWILYHPKLDQWYPDLLIWSQEGRAKDGNKAGFSNAPTNMNYYYDIFVNKKYNPKNFTEE